LKVKSPWTELVWKTPASSLRQALNMLIQGVHEEFLVEQLLEKDGDRDLIFLYHALDRLKERALLSLTVFHEEVPFLTFQPLTPSFKWQEMSVSEEEPLKLTRFCISYELNGEQVLETPLNAARMTLKSAESLSLIRALRKSTNLKELKALLPNLSQETIEKALSLLNSAKVLQRI